MQQRCSNERPGSVGHGEVLYVAAKSTSTVAPNYSSRFYRVFWCPEFPIPELGFGGNRPLWREQLRHERPWRSALYEDFQKRGQLNPVLVWNHRNLYDPGPKRWENYVKVGRNKCWCARQLGWKTVKVLLCQEEEPSEKYVGAFEEKDPHSVLDVWVDGDLHWTRSGLISTGCTDPAKLEYPNAST